MDSINLTYELDNGKQIRRRYNIWMDNEYVSSEAGRIANDYLTQWDTVNSRTIEVKGVEYNRLDYILQDVSGIYVDFMEGQKDTSRQEVLELVAALQADCAEGHRLRAIITTPAISGWKMNTRRTAITIFVPSVSPLTMKNTPGGSASTPTAITPSSG